MALTVYHRHTEMMKTIFQPAHHGVRIPAAQIDQTARPALRPHGRLGHDISRNKGGSRERKGWLVGSAIRATGLSRSNRCKQYILTPVRPGGRRSHVREDL